MCLFIVSVQCSSPNSNDKATERKLVSEAFNQDYYFLQTDENGIPNAEGLVLMHSKRDSAYVDPSIITNLVVTPIWDRSTFPYEILNFKNVTDLYLGMRSFESLPTEIVQLTKLESIDLQNSNLKYLPDNIDELKELREISLLLSNVEELPKSICNLKRLKRLHLGGTKIKELPNCLYQLNELKEFIFFYEEGEFSSELKEQLESLKIKMPNCKFILS